MQASNTDSDVSTGASDDVAGPEAQAESDTRRDGDVALSDERAQKPVLAASDAAPTAILSSPAPTLPTAPPAPPKPQLSASEAAELFAAAPEPAAPQYRRSSPPAAPADAVSDDVTRPIWQQPTSLLPTSAPAADSSAAPAAPDVHDARSSADERTEVLQLPDASGSGARAAAGASAPAGEPSRRVVFSKKWPFVALVDAHSENTDAASAPENTATAPRAEAAQAGAVEPAAAPTETAPSRADSLPDVQAADEPEIELTDEEIAAFGADPSWSDTESPLGDDISPSANAPRETDSNLAAPDHPVSGDAVAALFETTNVDTSDADTTDSGTTDVVNTDDETADDATARAEEEQEAAIDAIVTDAPEAHATPLGLIDSASAPASLDEERRAAGAPSYAAGSGVLSVSGLSKRFGDTIAVDGIDLEVSAGSFYGIVGPNGAGKTTTLSMITGLLRPDSGSITINGIDVWKEPDAAKRSIGVLPDHLRLFDRLTGSQLLYYSGVLRGIDGATVRSRVDDLAKAFGLEDALHRLVTDYSAGMTKKVALAAAMIHSPRMLVLDEPFESVDPVSAANVIEILQKYVDHGGTVVLSSHGMDLIQRVCDHVAIIVNGQVLAQGSVDEVRGTGTLEERFVELAGGRKAAEGMEWLHSFSD